MVQQVIWTNHRGAMPALAVWPPASRPTPARPQNQPRPKLHLLNPLPSHKPPRKLRRKRLRVKIPNNSLQRKVNNLRQLFLLILKRSNRTWKWLRQRLSNKTNSSNSSLHRNLLITTRPLWKRINPAILKRSRLRISNKRKPGQDRAHRTNSLSRGAIPPIQILTIITMWEVGSSKTRRGSPRPPKPSARAATTAAGMSMSLNSMKTMRMTKKSKPRSRRQGARRSPTRKSRRWKASTRRRTKMTMTTMTKTIQMMIMTRLGASQATYWI